MPEASDVQYLVLPDSSGPFLLARVRWPDVAQAISAGCPVWRDDVGLFDLPNDPSSAPVTAARAAEIADSWGALLSFDTTVGPSAPPLIRRMPANWSNLAPAERSAWALDSVTPRRRRARRSVRRRSPQRSEPRVEVPVEIAGEPEVEPQLVTATTPAAIAPVETTPDLEAPELVAPVFPTAPMPPAFATNGHTNGTAADAEPLPAVVSNGHGNGAGLDTERLPAVFSRMGPGPVAPPVATNSRGPDNSQRTPPWGRRSPTPHHGDETGLDLDREAARRSTTNGHSNGSAVFS